MEPLKINLIHQGAPRVHLDNGYVIRRGEGIAAVVIAMRSKRCDVDQHFSAYAGPELHIIATHDSLHLHMDKSLSVNDATIISLPEFTGWEVWLCEISKYTLQACLIKRDAERV